MEKLGTYELNNIYCEDSYKAIKNIPDKSIDLIYTDIPYKYENGGKGGTSFIVSEKVADTYHNKIDKFSYGINYSILEEFCRVLKNIYIYIWCSRDQILPITKFFVEEKGCRVNYLVWCKTNPTPFTNDMWLPDLEYCLCIKGKNAPRYNDGIENKSKFYISGKNKQDKDDYEHPTIKPLEMVKKHLLHSTNPGDIVADFFSGSGTTCVAAKELGRNYIGFEIDEHYHKLSVDRLNGINKNGQTDLFNTDFEQLSLLEGNK